MIFVLTWCNKPQPPGPPQKRDVVLAATVPIDARLQVNQNEVSLSGSLSLHLDVSASSPPVIDARLLNVVLFDVPQPMISGIPAANGVLGMTMMPSTNTRIDYDAQNRTLSGKIPVRAHFTQLDTLFPPKLYKENGVETDYATAQWQTGNITLTVVLAEPLETIVSKAKSRPKVYKISAQTTVEAEVAPLYNNTGGQQSNSNSVMGTPGPPETSVSGYQVSIKIPEWLIEIANAYGFDVVRNLCVQPVRIKDNEDDQHLTGQGLAVGREGAITQWQKADIAINFNEEWITIKKPGFKVIKAHGELTVEDIEKDLRFSLDVPSCVEVFFIQAFEPEGLHGGGATWPEGSESSKIITSDKIVEGGANPTHLAHELGHVLNVSHQQSLGSLGIPGLGGTLMCDSGFNVDNPPHNSKENADNAANPLLTVTIVPLGLPWDCITNAECGECR